MNNIITEKNITGKWGDYVLQKLNAFQMLNKHEYIIYLDADILVLEDLSNILNIIDIVWLNVNEYWKFNTIIGILDNSVDINSISCCQGGVVVFSDKLLKCKINDNYINHCYKDVKNLGPGGVDEQVLSYIGYSKHLEIKI